VCVHRWGLNVFPNPFADSHSNLQQSLKCISTKQRVHCVSFKDSAQTINIQHTQIIHQTHNRLLTYNTPNHTPNIQHKYKTHPITRLTYNINIQYTLIMTIPCLKQAQNLWGGAHSRSSHQHADRGRLQGLHGRCHGQHAGGCAQPAHRDAQAVPRAAGEDRG